MRLLNWLIAGCDILRVGRVIVIGDHALVGGAGLVAGCRVRNALLDGQHVIYALLHGLLPHQLILVFLGKGLGVVDGFQVRLLLKLQ